MNEEKKKTSGELYLRKFKKIYFRFILKHVNFCYKHFAFKKISIASTSESLYILSCFLSDKKKL